MVKHFNVWMAGLISGIVALFTSYLGVSGTIIGSVLSSFLYQLLSSYSAEKYDEGAIKDLNLANEIVYIFPLVVIGIIELIFLLSALHYRFDMLFDILEYAVADNLFRLMGVGLIILGAYPFYNSKYIDKRNGLVVLIVGVLLLLRGLMDISEITMKIFYMVFAPFDMIFALFVIITLALVIINILIGSDFIFKSSESIKHHKNSHARKVDTSFANPHINDDDHFNHPVDNPHINSGDDFNHPVDNPHINSGDDFNSPVDNPHINSGDDFNPPVDNDSPLNPDVRADVPNLNNQGNKEVLPIYEEEIILVNNPEDPENPIKKRILKRVKTEYDAEDDDYQELYIIDESE